MVENTVHLMRHRPLAAFANCLIKLFNELRQCCLSAARAGAVAHVKESLQAALNVLRTYHFEYGSRLSDEFVVLLKHFRDILVPLVNAHLKAIYGGAVGLAGEEVDAMFAGVRDIMEQGSG